MPALQHTFANSPEIGRLPTTRYRGSKRKLVPWIHASLKHLAFDSAIDIFGGTGSVSYLFKRMGKCVTYNDILRFNYKIGRALVANDNVILSELEIHQLIESASANDSLKIISENFRDYYFTTRENKWLDSVISSIQSWAQNLPFSTYKRDLVYYALFQTCLCKRPFNLFHRKNHYLRTAQVERNFGNKTTWDKPIKKTFNAFIKEANGLVFKGDVKCRAINYDALSIPDKHYDLAYIDPPYLFRDGGNEAADYLRAYHFLEGMCLYKNWPKLIDFKTRNRRLIASCENPWLDKKKNIKSLDLLFEKFSSSTLVVSYKKFGAPSIDTIVRLLKRHGKKVTCNSVHYFYALNHQNGEAKRNRECLVIGE